MLLKCPSCNSNYLVNSADLKPNGRTVRCAKCSYEWFQELNFVDEEISISSIPHASSKEKNVIEEELPLSSNLPSTYVRNEKASIINSILVLLLLVLAMLVFWVINNSEGIGIIALLDYYSHEFYFNLKLIIGDLAKIIHKIMN